MKTRLFVVLISMFEVCLAQDVPPAQPPSLEERILSYKDSDLEIITKSRKMLMDYLDRDAIDSAGEIYDYVKRKFEGGNVVSFWPVEDKFILLRIGYFNRLLLDMRDFAPVEDSYYEEKILPPRDLFLESLEKSSVVYKDNIMNRIDNSSLESFQTDFLRLFYYYLIADIKDSIITGDSLNAMADEYLAYHSMSPLNSFVRNYIRYKLKVSDWGYAYDIGLGSGIFDGNMSDYFTDNTVLGMGLDLARKKLELYARLNLGMGGFVKRPFEYGKPWRQGLGVTVYQPELSLGYNAIENSIFRAAPFAGVSWASIGSTEEEKKKPENDVELKWISALTFGANFDFKLSRKRLKLATNSEYGFMMLRLRIGYVNTRFERIVREFSGNAIYIYLGFGMFGRPVMRDL